MQTPALHSVGKAVLVGGAVLAAVGVSTLIASKFAKNKSPKGKKVLRHNVLVRFKESTTAQQIQAIEAQFCALKGTTGGVVYDFEWGTNVSVEQLDHGYTHCFFITFLGEAQRGVYLEHPSHVAFVRQLQPYLQEVTVLDYWTS